MIGLGKKEGAKKGGYVWRDGEGKSKMHEWRLDFLLFFFRFREMLYSQKKKKKMGKDRGMNQKRKKIERIGNRKIQYASFASTVLATRFS